MGRFIYSLIASAALTTALQTYAAPPSPPKDMPIPPPERAKIETVVHEYLLQHPEVIIEAVQNFQRKQYEQAEQTVKVTQQTAGNFSTQLFHNPGDPVAGDPNGKVTVVEFFDYQCPHCVDMAPVISDVIKSNPGLRVVFKEFPIRGPLSDLAARAALAANKQGKYYEFSHALLGANKPISQDLIFQIATQQGLNIDQLKKDMNDPSVAEELKNNQKLAQGLKLFGTPAFFIGPTNAKESKNINYVPGQMDQNQLQTAINKAKA